VATGGTDFTSNFTKALSSGADVLTGIVLNVSVAINNWAALGKPVPLVMSSTAATPSAIAPAGKGADRMYVAAWFVANHTTNDQQQALVATYKSMFQTNPPLLSNSAWDDVNVLKAAVESGGGSLLTRS
jgi:ABC-type branched-subunit amino acid transport system substrate-binding protein